MLCCLAGGQDTTGGGHAGHVRDHMLSLHYFLSLAYQTLQYLCQVNSVSLLGIYQLAWP